MTHASPLYKLELSMMDLQQRSTDHTLSGGSAHASMSVTGRNFNTISSPRPKLASLNGGSSPVKDISNKFETPQKFLDASKMLMSPNLGSTASSIKRPKRLEYAGSPSDFVKEASMRPNDRYGIKLYTCRPTWVQSLETPVGYKIHEDKTKKDFIS